MSRYHAELAWLGSRPEPDVLVEVDGGRFTAVTPGAAAPPEAIRLAGLTLPGLANTHSHAFHRALRGRTHAGLGTFWTWRERMYEVAQRLDPDLYLALATATYAEMARAGVTCVGEFHYLHHQRDGRPYADPNAMGAALVEAAARAGAGHIVLVLRTDYVTHLSGYRLKIGVSGWHEPVVIAWTTTMGSPHHARPAGCLQRCTTMTPG